MICSVCGEEVQFQHETDDENIVCKKCIRVRRNNKTGKITGLDTLQKAFQASLEYLPPREIHMKRLTLYCNFARDKLVLFDDVGVHFDTSGYGSTPEHNRPKIAKYMRQRPGRVSIVEDVPEEVVAEAEMVAEEINAAPAVKEEPVVSEVVEPEPEKVEVEEAPVVEEPKAETTDETPPPPRKKKRGRKPKKNDSEDN